MFSFIFQPEETVAVKTTEEVVEAKTDGANQESMETNQNGDETTVSENNGTEAVKEETKAEGETEAASTPNASKLFVGRLPFGTKEDELTDLFSKFGTVSRCDIVGKYGFVVSCYC